jgi:hypothetical protein
MPLPNDCRERNELGICQAGDCAIWNLGNFGREAMEEAITDLRECDGLEQPYTYGNVEACLPDSKALLNVQIGALTFCLAKCAPELLKNREIKS